MSIILSVRRLEMQSDTNLHKWLSSKDCANRGKKHTVLKAKEMGELSGMVSPV